MADFYRRQRRRLGLLVDARGELHGGRFSYDADNRRRMSDYGRGAWCDVLDGLYWRFVAKHRDFFAAHTRLSVMVGGLDRLTAPRKSRIFAAAETFLARCTRTPS